MQIYVPCPAAAGRFKAEERGSAGNQSAVAGQPDTGTRHELTMMVRVIIRMVMAVSERPDCEAISTVIHRLADMNDRC